MSLEKNKALVRKFAEEFKNRGRHSIVREVMSEGFVHHFKDPRLPPGRQALELLGGMVVAAFPDVHATIEDLIAEGDRVVERTSAAGTHTGEFQGVPATQRRVAWTEIHIYRIADGRIVELWSEIDFLAIMMQIGAVGGGAK